MKKLRALFAILLAVCMLCSMAIAEEVAEVEEVVVDEVVVTEEAADEATATETVAAEEEATKTSDVDAQEVIDPNGEVTPTGDDHETDPDKTEGRKWANETHQGEVEFGEDVLDALRELEKGDELWINDVRFECTQAFDCSKEQAGIYEYQCQINQGYGPGIDQFGYEIWHRYAIPAKHLWASEAHVQNQDWAMVNKEATCTEAGEGYDYCLRCLQKHLDAAGNPVTRKIEPMGHSFQNPDDLRVNLVVVTEPNCKNTGSVALKCAVCGATMKTITGFTWQEMGYLAQSQMLGYDGHYNADINLGDEAVTSIRKAVSNIDDYTWFNREQFQMQYKNWVQHHYDGWFYTKKPTCAEWGEQIRTCKICAEKYKRGVPALVASYKLDSKKTMLLDCYHEAQVWECENCHGTTHPDIIRVRRVVSHDKDLRVAALIDQAAADPTVTSYTYNGKTVYQAPTCLAKGFKFYICKHENDDEHAFSAADEEFSEEYEDENGETQTDTWTENKLEQTFNKKYPKVTKGFWLWRGWNMPLGISIEYDAETESRPVKFVSYELQNGSFKCVERPLPQGWPGEWGYDEGAGADWIDIQEAVDKKYRQDLENYEFDNQEWASQSYHDEVFSDKYSHKNDKAYQAKGLDYTEIPALGHDWSAWVLMYDKNHNGGDNEYGYYQRVCNRCGLIDETVAAEKPNCETQKPAEKHDWKLISTTKATCTTAGEEVYRCTKCGAPKTVKTADALGHTWDEGKVTKEATCTAAGEKVFTCKTCGGTMKEAIPALGHKIVEIPAVAATTTAKGATAGKKCSVCGEILEAPVEVPMITVDNKYEIDLDKVTKGGETRGTGEVKIVEGNQKAPQLYARVTWVYELANGDSFAYCAMKEVKSAEDALTFNMVSPKQPYGATLVDVQIALVTDAEADASGSYNALATAKK